MLYYPCTSMPYLLQLQERGGKCYLLGVDVSGSMDCNRIAGMAGLSARDAAAAVMMALLRTEPSAQCMAFSTTLM